MVISNQKVPPPPPETQWQNPTQTCFGVHYDTFYAWYFIDIVLQEAPGSPWDPLAVKRIVDVRAWISYRIHDFSMGCNYSAMPHFHAEMRIYIQIFCVLVITYSSPKLDHGLTDHCYNKRPQSSMIHVFFLFIQCQPDNFCRKRIRGLRAQCINISIGCSWMGQLVDCEVSICGVS